jgi:hypothetical protein
MIRTVTLADFTDLLAQAQKIGIDWNTAHTILVDDDVPPMYETKTRDFYFSEFARADDPDCNPYGYSDETFRIMVSFMVEHNLAKFTLVND